MGAKLKCFGPLHKGALVSTEEFGKAKKPKACKACKAVYSKRRMELKRDQLLEQGRQWKKANKTKVREMNKAWAKSHPEYRRAYRRRRHRIAMNRLWDARLTLINGYLIAYPRLVPFVSDLIGCNRIGLWEHIERQFLPGMSAENYGSLSTPGSWEVDSIRPVRSFDLSTLEGQKAAFHYSNFQPLWGLDNKEKGNLIDLDLIQFKYEEFRANSKG